jgi:hypothetical protein
MMCGDRPGGRRGIGPATRRQGSCSRGPEIVGGPRGVGATCASAMPPKSRVTANEARKRRLIVRVCRSVQRRASRRDRRSTGPKPVGISFSPKASCAPHDNDARASCNSTGRQNFFAFSGFAAHEARALEAEAQPFPPKEVLPSFCCRLQGRTLWRDLDGMPTISMDLTGTIASGGTSFQRIMRAKQKRLRSPGWDPARVWKSDASRPPRRSG